MFYLRQHSLNTQVEKELEIIIKKYDLFVLNVFYLYLIV